MPNLVKIRPAVLEKKIFFKVVNVFSQLSPLGKGQGFHLNKRESPSPKDNLCRVWLELAHWFLKFVNVFSQFRNYIPLEKGGPFIWYKLEFPPQRCFVPNLVKFAQQLWRRRFLKICQCIFAIISPLKGRCPLFEETWIPFTKDALCQVWLKLAQWLWWRRWKCDKFTTTTTTPTTTTTTDNGQILIRKAHLSLWLRWAKNVSSLRSYF